MGRVILRRIAGAIPVVLLVTLITFGLMRLIPGDVSAALAGVSATPAEREQIRHNLGLDQPVQVQLVRWYSDLLRGGTSFREELRAARIRVAAERLLVSDDKLESIAAGVGYSSLSHFGQAFAAVMGLTPLAFRRQSRSAAASILRR